MPSLMHFRSSTRGKKADKIESLLHSNIVHRQISGQVTRRLLCFALALASHCAGSGFAHLVESMLVWCIYVRRSTTVSVKIKLKNKTNRKRWVVVTGHVFVPVGGE